MEELKLVCLISALAQMYPSFFILDIKNRYDIMQ